MLKTIIMVPVIMGCALAGTVGLIKGINKFFPGQFNQPESAKKNTDEER